jgi:hypothetical protein
MGLFCLFARSHKISAQRVGITMEIAEISFSSSAWFASSGTFFFSTYDAIDIECGVIFSAKS